MTSANIERLGKALRKRFNIKNSEDLKSSNLPNMINLKEIKDFQKKYKCKFFKGSYGLCFFEQDGEDYKYKLEFYKGKIIVSKIDTF